jgi:hypothetical protein
MASSGEESYARSSSDDKLLAQDDTYNIEEEGHTSERASIGQKAVKISIPQ